MANINPIATPGNYPSSGEVIWVRVENVANCVTVGSFNLLLGLVPTYTEVPLFSQCDDDVVDGFTEFDLNSQNATIINGNINLSVSYYATQADADSSSNPLAIPYINTVNPEIIFVRVEDNTTGCYGTFEMILEVVAPPSIFQPAPLEYCDEDNDGFGEFTLTDADQDVTGGIPTGNLMVTYHYLLADAQNGVLPLPIIYLNDVPFLQTVYVRLLDQSTGCFSITTLDLIVLDTPAIAQPADLEACDDDNDGVVLFDLTQTETAILNGLDPLLYTISYFEDINLTIPIVNTTSYPNTSSPQTIYVLVEDNATGCSRETTFQLWVFLPPILIAPTELALCDVTEITGPNDEQEPFDLDSKINEITGGDANIDITFHLTQADADAGIDPLVSLYTNILNPQTIFIRGDDINTDCVVSTGVTLSLVVNPLPSPVTPTPLEVCDDDADGFALFTLTDKDIEIIGGEPGVTITYHESFLDADMGINALLSPYTNMLSPSQLIYARAEYIVPATGCYKIVPLELIVNPSPTIPIDLDDLVACDSDGDGVELFDLTLQDAAIYGSQDPNDFTLGYYETLLDAQTGINAIATPTAYPNTGNPQTIWVRLENDTTLCVSIGSFELILGVAPAFTEVTLFEQCDDEVVDGFTAFDLNSQNTTITGGNINLSVSYHATAADANSASNPLTIPHINTSNPEIIYVRVEDNTTACYGIFAMELRVLAPPAITQPNPLVYCDEDNDGFGEFTLTDADLEVTGGIPPGNLVVTYHYLIEDAQNGVLPLPAIYLNDVPFLQTIYVRLLDQTTGCYSITSLDLIVNQSPQIITPTDLVLCDDDNDGIEVFDLTSVEPELLNGIDPATVLISYYQDINLTIAIANPSAYSNIPPSPQTIYIVVEDIVNGCQSQETVQLWVNLPPVLVAPTPLELCDVTEIDGPDDEKEPFDLESKTDEITGGDSNISITYYETQADADAGTNPLTSPYINTTNTQTVFIRAESQNTLCVVSQGITLDLVVNPLPSPITPTPLEVCDVDNDGFASFTLTDKDIEIIGGEPGVTISYYESPMDAELGIFALTSPYGNIQTPSQTIYVRAEYAAPGTGCFRVIELELIVNPTPIVPLDIEDLVICDPEGDGIEVFDLTLRADVIYGTQDPNDYTLTYHTTEPDATAGANAIANPGAYTNTSNPQIIYVRATIDAADPDSCFEIVELLLQVDPLPDDSVVISPYIICEVPSDGEAIFDLTTKTDEILNGQDPLVYQVTYYEIQAEADAMFNPIIDSDQYTNTSNPQTIYVVIQNINTLCFVSTLSFEIEEMEGAIANTPATYAVCDTYNENDGIAEFDLTNPDLIAEILGGQDITVYPLVFYGTLADADAETNPLIATDPFVNTINPQIIYARVTNTATGCYAIAEVLLKVELLPIIDIDGEYRICVDTNGNTIPSEEGLPSPPIIDTGLDPSLYIFQWLLNGDTILGEIGASIAVMELGTYTVVVTEILTGCSSEASATVSESSPPETYSAQVISGAFADAHTIEAMATGDGTYVFSLDGGPYQDSGIFTDVAAGNHIITIKDEKGCGSVTIEVGVIDYPQFMTPNADGYHDTWNIIGIAAGDPTAKIYIFDRYGKLLKQLSPLGEGWDGTYNGNPLPSSDYWFRVQYTENETNKEFKGHFTLKR
ncbi:MAG: hypothetical protein COB12_07200 [Flavobacterium sp.]|nr:MAG: hypothetical protein COB12_07200 [Flavobacterium sp.]